MSYTTKKLLIAPIINKKVALKKLPEKTKRQTSIVKNGSANAIIIDQQLVKKISAKVLFAKRKLSNAPAGAMPENLKPMLASSLEEPFDDDDWQFEIKLDGYRALAYINNSKVDIRSRNNNSFNQKFSAVVQTLTQWNINAVVDGEIMVLNDEGQPDFNDIQQWDKTQQGQLVYYVFDLLWLDGLNIMDEPLHLRREVLKQIMTDDGAIRFSDHIDGIGKDFFEAVKNNGLEGIIAKQKNAPYLPGYRSKTWIKIKAEQKQEAIICGYTKKRNSDRQFSSLVLGIMQKNKLIYLGLVGTGFSIALQDELLGKMKNFVTEFCPFAKEPAIIEYTVWLKPRIVCEVKYTELTKEGVMRHASFQGLREDKTVADFNDEVNGVEKESSIANEQKQLFNSKQINAIVSVDKQELKLTNLNKIYWPKEKITKGRLLNYYFEIAEFMMPYMKDRPQSLNRFPDGITGENFYHKNMNGKIAPWLKTFERFSESNQKPNDFLICTNTASLIYMANLGCIEMNPWHSKIQSPLRPDWCVIDLDPGDIGFQKTIETALVVKEVLQSLGVTSYPKTSGSTGIHIYIPLGAKYNYEQSKQLAELVANMVHNELPAFTSIERNPQLRKTKIYIDYLQNRPVQTICAPYSVRPKAGATVSAPLHWSEVKKGLKINQFTINNMEARVKAEGDLFAGVLGKGIDLNKVLKGLAQLI